MWLTLEETCDLLVNLQGLSKRWRAVRASSLTRKTVTILSYTVFHLQEIYFGEQLAGKQHDQMASLIGGISRPIGDTPLIV